MSLTLRHICAEPGFSLAGAGPITLVAAGAPRTGSTWQHRALSEIITLSPERGERFRFGYLGAKPGERLTAREATLLASSRALIKIHDTLHPSRAEALTRASLVFVSTRGLEGRTASAFGTSWVWSGTDGARTSQYQQQQPLTTRAIADYFLRTRASESKLRARACRCCTQRYQLLKTAGGRIHLLRQYNIILNASLTAGQLQLVHARMENFSLARQSAAQRSSSEEGRSRLAHFVPRWRQLLRSLAQLPDSERRDAHGRAVRRVLARFQRPKDGQLVSGY